MPNGGVSHTTRDGTQWRANIPRIAYTKRKSTLLADPVHVAEALISYIDPRMVQWPNGRRAGESADYGVNLHPTTQLSATGKH